MCPSVNAHVNCAVTEQVHAVSSRCDKVDYVGSPQAVHLKTFSLSSLCTIHRDELDSTKILQPVSPGVGGTASVGGPSPHPAFQIFPHPPHSQTLRPLWWNGDVIVTYPSPSDPSAYRGGEEQVHANCCSFAEKD